MEYKTRHLNQLFNLVKLLGDSLELWDSLNGFFLVLVELLLRLIRIHMNALL